MSKLSLNLFQNDLDNKVKQICKNIKKDDELEVSFGGVKSPINLKKYYNLLKYQNYRSKRDKLKIEKITTLDISYTYEKGSSSTYRISITSIDEINNFIQNNNLLKNHTIFSKQISMLINQDNSNNIILINKIKSTDRFIALDEYDIRIKLSGENSDIDQSVLEDLLRLDEIERHNISFRYKQRVSLVIEDNDDYIMKIDLTEVKGSKMLNSLIENISKYELEIDISFKKAVNSKKLSDICDKMAETMLNLEQFLQESSLLITKTETINVVKSLNKLAYGDENEVYKDLPAMQSASTEVFNILDTIPGNYTVTDKADGERYFLIIYENQVYLISGNLNVKKIKSSISEKNSVYNLTVLDGEYLYVPKYKKFLFLVFDILFFQGKDVRNEELLENRLLLVCKTLKDVFSVDLNIGVYTKDYNLDDIYNFHKNNIETHMNQLNKHLEKSSDNQVINGKYFIFTMPVGLQSEIYQLSTLLYESYTLNTKLGCPYLLDGLIYTPLNQKYTRNQRETKFKILKWKPEKTNSIDFYIQFERNPETNKIVTVYDRTNDNVLEDYLEKKKSDEIDFNDMSEYTVKNSVYQIINLYVGKIKNNQENPILFQKNNDNNSDNYQAFVYLNNGFPRDIEGNIIQDNTVVEFAYDNNSDALDKFRWIPLRTRFDKTESVMRHKRKYGNNSDIADRVWNSIKNPITFDDIKLLGDQKLSENHIKFLKSKITSETISLSRRDDKYYQLITNLGKPMRNFHNWIKSNMIYTYCNRKVLLNSTSAAMEVLDLGVGKGGDLLKLYHAKIKSAVCIDINEAGIYSGSDGAISRYNVMKKTKPHFPKMLFVVADGRQKLNFSNQSLTGKMNDQNAKILKQVFGENEQSKNHYTFDIINSQFMIHYLLQDNNTWNNFCSNVNKYLKKDGYILITTLDGSIVHDSFNNNHITREYIDDNGQKKILFDIIKKYPEDLNINKLKKSDNHLGIQIDVHLPIFMEENEYQSEYLVIPSFLINELKSKCNMRLIETESFANLYYVYQDFFQNTANYESKIETRKFFNDVKEFYNFNNAINKNWFEYSKLHRYFIFQKK